MFIHLANAIALYVASAYIVDTAAVLDAPTITDAAARESVWVDTHCMLASLDRHAGAMTPRTEPVMQRLSYMWREF